MIVVIMILYQFAILLADIVHLVFTAVYLTLLEAWYLITPPKMKSLVGETVMVTGAGHGIGKEMALQLAKLGSKVICLDLNEDWNDKTVKQITADGGASYGFRCDVSDREDVRNVCSKIRRTVGDITVLVNNVGIMPSKPFLRYSPAEVKNIFAVNVFSQFWMIQEWLPSLMSNGHGHIVFMSSMCGVMGTGNLVPYCSSKYAVTGLMEALNEELRYGNQNPGIKMTRVHPYTVDTGLAKKPRIRFPALNPILTPTSAASMIIESMRREEEILYLPRRDYYLHKIVNCWPRSVVLAFLDFMDTGVDPHEE